MFDIARLRDQLSCDQSEVSPKSRREKRSQASCILVLFILGSLTLYYSASGFIPMRAKDFYRLDAVVQKLASERQIDTNQMWQKIFFKLHISDISDLKMSHVDEASQIILEEIGKGDSLK